MTCKEIIINIMICIATGIITGAIVTKYYKNIDDKRNRVVFLMDLANRSVKITKLALEPIRFIGNRERLYDLQDLVFNITYYPQAGNLKGIEADFYKTYKGLSKKISDAVLVYMSYFDIPSTVLNEKDRRKLNDGTQRAQMEFIDKFEKMQPEIIKLTSLANCIIEQYNN